MHKEIVDKIYSEKAVKNKVSKDLSNTLDILSKTVFGDINRFVFELLQNADDSGEKGNSLNVSFRLLDNYLIFSHNGKHFTSEDVEGISSVGSRVSQKDKDKEKTGYKGVGFKSVFGSSDYAYIASGGFHFRFDRNFFDSPDEYPWQVIPIWTNSPPDEATEWIDSQAVTTVIAIKDRDVILKEIKDILDDCQIILFLRRVSTITFFSGGEKVVSISRKKAEDRVILYNNGKPESSWILKSVDLTVSEDLSKHLSRLSDTECPQKLKNTKTTKLTFAAKVEDDRLIAMSQTVIYSYLPTKAKKGFPFLINGDFLTNAERTGLMPNVWNEFLFKEIATRQIEWFKDLQKTIYKYDVLILLKEKYDFFSDTQIEQAYNIALQKAAENNDFLPVQDSSGRNVTISNGIIDQDHLSKFFDPYILLSFMGLSHPNSVLSLQLQRQEVLEQLGAKKFSFKDAFVIMTSGKATDIDSAVRFMVFFYNNTLTGDKPTWIGELQNASFIMDESGCYRSPKEIFLPAEKRIDYAHFGSISYIHSAILDHFKNIIPSFLKWLDNLGVKEPDSVEIFRKAVLPMITTNSINKENFLAITDFVFMVHQSKSLTEQDYLKLRSLPVSTNKGFLKPSQVYLPDEYNPDQKLLNVLQNANFLSGDYLRTNENKVEWKVFFKRIGVRDKISIDVLEEITERSAFVESHPEAEAYFNWLDDIEAYPSLYYPWRFSGQHHIGNFTKVEFRSHLKETKFSKSFWSGMLDNWEDFRSKCSNTRYFRRGGSDVVPSYFEYYVVNFPSVPANDGNCYCSTHLFSPALRPVIGEYLPLADFPASITKDQIAFFRFKTALSLTECLEILNKISLSPLSPDRKKQIFAVYDYMIGHALVGNSEILAWRKNAKLLAMDNSFQSIEKLYIFNVYENISLGNPDRFLKLSMGSSNDETNALAKLLMVPVISMDMLEFIKKGEIVDTDLKSAINQRLVYLAVIHAHNTGDNLNTVVDRLRVMVDTRTFYKAEQLKLVYRSKENEVIIDNEIDVWSTQTSNIYYTGYWKSALVLYSLSSILCDMLLLKNMERELALVLQLSDKEIKPWLIKKGYNVDQLEEQGLFLTEYQTSDSEDEQSGREDADIPQETAKVEVFVENAKVRDIDFSNVSPIQKEAGSAIFSSSMEYEPIENAEVRRDIGRWSEEYIFAYFKSKPDNFTSVKWMNENGESHLPYDFEIVENGVEKLVEVKGTPSLDKTLFYLSKKEWQVMIHTGKEYSIFRVYGAGRENNRMDRIDNVMSLINEGIIDFKVELFI